LLGNPWRRIATVGAIGSLVSLFLLRFPVGGPGLEEALLIIASFGAALVASAGLDRLGREPIRGLAALAAAAIIVVASCPFANGGYGLPSGQVNGDLGCAAVLAGETGAGRVLVASPDRTDIPGEARSGPGFWYRLIEAPGVTHDQIWLPPARD